MYNYVLLPVTILLLVVHGRPLVDTLWLYVVTIAATLLFTAAHHTCMHHFRTRSELTTVETDMFIIGTFLTVVNTAVATSVIVFKL